MTIYPDEERLSDALVVAAFGQYCPQHPGVKVDPISPL